MHTKIELRVNGKHYEMKVNNATTLLQLLREDLGLTGTKEGCGAGECGACTVLLDGKPVNSCMTLAVQVHGKSVLTIEGVGEGEQLHPLQEAFINEGAVQCGFCTPGMILSAKALLDKNPSPNDDDIKEALAGNLCRCTGYVKIIKAVKAAAGQVRSEA
ncbi:MAG: (2Fe-2S)-binding protein [Dehalobacterium sp.]